MCLGLCYIFIIHELMIYLLQIFKKMILSSVSFQVEQNLTSTYFPALYHCLFISRSFHSCSMFYLMVWPIYSRTVAKEYLAGKCNLKFSGNFIVM